MRSESGDRQREINDEILNCAQPLSAQEAPLLNYVTANFPRDKSIDFWDGAMWAIVHFNVISERRLPLDTQLRGFMYALAVTYKKALSADGWESEIDV